MSLWLYRASITRALTGELSASREARLRRHLGRCAACRQYYDAASWAAGAGAGARERARLQHALGLRIDGAAAVAPRPPRWVLAPMLLVPVAAIVMMIVVRPWSTREEAVTERGGAGGPAESPLAQQVRASLVVRFYARRMTPGQGQGPVRLVGELPGSGELRVARDEQLQVAYVGLKAPRYLQLVVRDERGRITSLHPRAAEQTAALLPTEEPRLLNQPFSPADLGARLRITATVARQPDERTPAVFSAELWVTP